MSNQYDNSNRGAVWHNTKKREGKRDPHLTGMINVEGVDYFLSVWENDKKGQNQPVLTMSIRKDDRNENSNYQTQNSSYKAEAIAPDDEIPW